MGHRFALDMGEGRLVPADMLSEGTVLALGLLTALRHPQCPRLILMDDIDGALHSSAQAELVRCLRKIQKDRPDVQIVCTSHSADLLDHVELEEVRVMVLDADGYARCGRLSDHPQSAQWRKMLRTGEFWASVGEDWLLEARRASSAHGAPQRRAHGREARPPRLQ
jgi:predicted ATPase